MRGLPRDHELLDLHAAFGGQSVKVNAVGQAASVELESVGEAPFGVAVVQRGDVASVEVEHFQHHGFGLGGVEPHVGNIRSGVGAGREFNSVVRRSFGLDGVGRPQRSGHGNVVRTSGRQIRMHDEVSLPVVHVIVAYARVVAVRRAQDHVLATVYGQKQVAVGGQRQSGGIVGDMTDELVGSIEVYDSQNVRRTGYHVHFTVVVHGQVASHNGCGGAVHYAVGLRVVREDLLRALTADVQDSVRAEGRGGESVGVVIVRDFGGEVSRSGIHDTVGGLAVRYQVELVFRRVVGDAHRIVYGVQQLKFCGTVFVIEVHSEDVRSAGAVCTRQEVFECAFAGFGDALAPIIVGSEGAVDFTRCTGKGGAVGYACAVLARGVVVEVAFTVSADAAVVEDSVSTRYAEAVFAAGLES